jgi:hypothetical protein
VGHGGKSYSSPLVPTSVNNAVSTALWVLAGIGQFAAMVIMVRRKFFREFPAFFCYLIFHVIGDLVGFFVIHQYGRDSWQYYYQYWAAQAIFIALRFGVIYEIFSHVLQPYEGLWHLALVLFRWAGVVLVLAAAVTGAVGPSHEPDWAINGAVIVERSIDVVQCGLLIFLFVFSSYFGLTWRHHVFGIALGLGVVASMEFLAAALGTQFNSLTYVIINLLPRAAYDSAAMIWILYLRSPEPSRKQVGVMPQNEIERWNLELLQLLRR